MVLTIGQVANAADVNIEMPGLGAELSLGLETDHVSVFPGRIDV